MAAHAWERRHRGLGMAEQTAVRAHPASRALGAGTLTRYDLDSTGTSVNGISVRGKIPLSGRSILRIADEEFILATDKDLLL